ncbi:signal peptidase I [Arthrobacter koreensis]|uniref:Signal peptidase I n=1 Tax=Arthrobacter koreensis TaxID=199136 RepID=A0ABY6FWQ7_9MICC|nr:signal peptidase I [Arthrobacter koreensis]MEB7448669.1 signal peptidase I [Arthrobacter koreensis]UYB37673.1 signal peptidase I [Arthrobacter koreensis]
MAGWRFVLWALAGAVVLAGLVRAFIFDVYYIPSDSMQPLLEPGDRVLVSRTEYRGSEIQRGDVVVFDGRGSLAPLHSSDPALKQAADAAAQWLGLAGSDTVYIKRVIGVPGDRVACCTDGGGLTVNGQPIREPYLFPGDRGSEMPFDVVVPEGRLWLLGDHRSDSADSRTLLGAPGGGLIPEDRVIGRAQRILWPFDRTTGIERLELDTVWQFVE